MRWVVKTISSWPSSQETQRIHPLCRGNRKEAPHCLLSTHLHMSHTKQTAQNSTWGKVLRLHLDTKGARVTAAKAAIVVIRKKHWWRPGALALRKIYLYVPKNDRAAHQEGPVSTTGTQICKWYDFYNKCFRCVSCGYGIFPSSGVKSNCQHIEDWWMKSYFAKDSKIRKYFIR